MPLKTNPLCRGKGGGEGAVLARPSGQRLWRVPLKMMAQKCQPGGGNGKTATKMLLLKTVLVAPSGFTPTVTGLAPV